MVLTLVMGMKSLLYSLSSHGNTALQRGPLPPGLVLQPTFGLREEELEVRAQGVGLRQARAQGFGSRGLRAQGAEGAGLGEQFALAPERHACNCPCRMCPLFTPPLSLCFRLLWRKEGWSPAARIFKVMRGSGDPHIS